MKELICGLKREILISILVIFKEQPNEPNFFNHSKQKIFEQPIYNQTYNYPWQ